MLHKKILFGALALLSTVTAMNARQLTIEEAMSAAGITDSRLGAAPLSPAAAYTIQKEGLNTVYVLPSSQGFVVLAADDVAPAVLGYADNATFDPNNIPPNMKAWLDDYSAYIAYAAENGRTVIAAPADPSLTDIAPITKTKWDQGWPYYNDCPKVGTQRTYTGCVATAIAQVMKTYDHPVHGTGSHSYTWNNQTLSFDYENTTFKWDLMTDTYSNSSSPASCAAIAELMYAIGVSCNMGYGTGGSGANGANMAIGLMRNLGYDKSLEYIGRDYFTLPEWSRMLHTQLLTGHPLYYDGANESVGHAFVVDGYRSRDGFFHINWGWSGVSDGYFSIITLDPDTQGIGGSTEGYFLGQNAILGLIPDEGSPLKPQFLATEILTEPATYGRDEEAEIGSANSGFYNLTLSTIDCEFGVEFTPDDGGDPLYAFYPEKFNLQYGYGYTGYSFTTEEIPNGSYTVRPVGRANGITQRMLINISEPRFFNAVLTDDEVIFTPVPIVVNLSVENLTPAGPFFRSKECFATATITNQGDDEYYDTIRLRFTNPNGNFTNMGYAVVDLLPGESTDIILRGVVPFVMTVGTGKIQLYDGNNHPIGEPVDVICDKAPTGSPNPQISNAKIADAPGAGTIEEPFVTNGYNTVVNADLNVGAGYFTSNVLVAIFDTQTGANVGQYNAPFVCCWGTETQHLSIPCELSESLSYDNLYTAVFFYLNGNSYVQMTEGFYFRISEETGIASPLVTTFGLYPNPATDKVTVTAPADIASVEVYDLAGVLHTTQSSTELDVTGLAAGQYIVKVATIDGVSKALRLIKK